MYNNCLRSSMIPKMNYFHLFDNYQDFYFLILTRFFKLSKNLLCFIFFGAPEIRWLTANSLNALNLAPILFSSPYLSI